MLRNTMNLSKYSSKMLKMIHIGNINMNSYKINSIRLIPLTINTLNISKCHFSSEITKETNHSNHSNMSYNNGMDANRDTNTNTYSTIMNMNSIYNLDSRAAYFQMNNSLTHDIQNIQYLYAHYKVKDKDNYNGDNDSQSIELNRLINNIIHVNNKSLVRLCLELYYKLYTILYTIHYYTLYTYTIYYILCSHYIPTILYIYRLGN